MSKNPPPALGWYFKLFRLLAKKRLKLKDTDLREIHAVIVTVLSTGILMWAYALLAITTISSPIPGIVGFIAAIIHGLSPLLFYFTNSAYLVSNILLLAGMCHQGCFAFYTGGFDSNILIWFGVLPMLGGVCAGRKGVITWSILTVTVSMIFFYLYWINYPFPNQITKIGHLWTQFLLVFGWIFISTLTVTVYTVMRENTEKLLNQQGHKIDDLFRVLFHDLSNPLGRIAMGITIAKRESANKANRGLEIASQATDSMLEITQNVRRMYAISRGKANMNLVSTSILDAVDYINKVFANDLNDKNLKIITTLSECKHAIVKVEPVSFKNQVLGNIISNAIKFSPEGGVIKIHISPYNQDHLQINISDDGEGIPLDLLEHMFDLSKKTTRPGTKGETGTGFGMHIMKSFVEMYGGEIKIDSMTKEESSKSGTTIRLILKGEWL